MRKILIAVILLVVITGIIGIISYTDGEKTIRQADAIINMYEGGK